MTEPRERQPGVAVDPGLEVRPEVIEDLDVTGGDADNIVGGCIGAKQLQCSHIAN